MYNLNINKSSVVPTNLIVGRVIDKPFDSIYFKIFDGQTPFDLTGCTIDFRGTTPDGRKVVSNNVPITNSRGGEIRFTFPSNFYSAKGHFQNAYFVIKKGGYIESTNDLLINVLNAVDLNVDDAPIIIDQLDDLIQAVIDDVNKQLSTVKADIKQTQNNVDALKKDVDAYKKEFASEIAKMQKQLDDLSKAINQTDIQRPQITSPEGEAKYTLSDMTITLQEWLNELDSGYHKIYIRFCKDCPEQYLMGFVDISLQGKEGNAVLTAMGTGNTYTYTYATSGSKGWNKLTGQVYKITPSEDNATYWTMKDTTKTAMELLQGVTRDYQAMNFLDSKGQPEQYLIGKVQTAPNGNAGIFVGTSSVTGNTYSYGYNNGKSDGWKKLDGQGKAITSDNGSPLYQYSGNINLLSELKKNGRGLYTVRATSTNGQLPMNNHVFVLTVNAIEVTTNGVVNHATILAQSTTTNHVYSSSVYVDRVTPWVNLNGQATKITQDDGKLRYITRSDNMTAFELFKEYGDGIFTVYIHTSVGQPENYIMGTLVQNKASTGIMEGVFTGTGISTGEMYTYTFASSGIKGWRKVTSVKV